MADPDGRHLEMITQLFRQGTSSSHDVDVKGDIFRRTICPPSLVVIAFIFSELRMERARERGGNRPPPPPPPHAVRRRPKKSPVLINRGETLGTRLGLNRVNELCQNFLNIKSFVKKKQKKTLFCFFGRGPRLMAVTLIWIEEIVFWVCLLLI